MYIQIFHNLFELDLYANIIVVNITVIKTKHFLFKDFSHNKPEFCVGVSNINMIIQ